MNARFDTRAYLIASVVGSVGFIVFGLVQLGVTYMTLAGAGDIATDPSKAQSYLLVTGATTVISCLCASLINIGTGAVYGGWVGRAGSAAADEGAIGGAASTATAQLVSGVVQAGIGLLVTPMIMQQVGSQFGGGLTPEMLGVNMASSVVGSLFGICIGVVIGALMGALGGVIGTLITRRR